MKLQLMQAMMENQANDEDLKILTIYNAVSLLQKTKELNGLIQLQRMVSFSLLLHLNRNIH